MLAEFGLGHRVELAPIGPVLPCRRLSASCQPEKRTVSFCFRIKPG
jgi:hypothetical protein